MRKNKRLLNGLLKEGFNAGNLVYYYILPVGCYLLAYGCTAKPVYRSEVKFYQVGMASYYAEKFHGRLTACGDVFDMNKLTAAHKKLPCGTKVRVHNLSNGENVVVIINDRGPFKKGRIIDLSKESARRIDMIENGTAKDGLEIIEWGDRE